MTRSRTEYKWNTNPKNGTCIDIEPELRHGIGTINRTKNKDQNKTIKLDQERDKNGMELKPQELDTHGLKPLEKNTKTI